MAENLTQYTGLQTVMQDQSLGINVMIFHSINMLVFFFAFIMHIYPTSKETIHNFWPGMQHAMTKETKLTNMYQYHPDSLIQSVSILTQI